MEADSTGSAVGPPAAEDSSSPDVDADALAFPRGLLYPLPVPGSSELTILRDIGSVGLKPSSSLRFLFVYGGFLRSLR